MTMRVADSVIGIDIGGTNIRIATVSEGGEISLFEKASSSVLGKSNATKSLADFIEDYINRHSLKRKIKAVSIGIPAIISRDRKGTVSCPNLKGLEGINITDSIFERLLIPVYLDRDVNNLLISDMKTLKIDRRKTVCGFYIGTGFGNAISINGEIYRGKNSAAGELGHIPLFSVTDKCTCDNIGCVETRCSGRYLEKLCSENFPKADIHRIFSLYPHSKVLLEFVRNLAYPIATEITILDPDICIVAGGVTDMPDFPKETLIEEIYSKVRKPYPLKGLEIVFSTHNQQSGVYGSAAAAFYKLKKENHI